MKSLGIGQGPEPQLVVKATQSATLVSASHLSFSARTQHADSAVHNDTHNKYIILHNATLSFSSLPVQCPMIWSQSILFSFNFTSFFLGTSKTFRYFLTSLFQERKVFLFSRILSKSKYFSEVDQVCTILSRAIPFRASTERGAQYQSSPFFSVAFDTVQRRVPGQGPSYTWWWCQCDDENRCAIWARCQPIPKSLQSLPMHAFTFRSVIETNTPNNDRFIYGTVLSRTWL